MALLDQQIIGGIEEQESELGVGPVFIREVGMGRRRPTDKQIDLIGKYFRFSGSGLDKFNKDGKAYLAYMGGVSRDFRDKITATHARKEADSPSIAVSQEKIEEIKGQLAGCKTWEEFGKKLVELRKAMGFDKEVGKKEVAQQSEISAGSLSAIEHGQRAKISSGILLPVLGFYKLDVINMPAFVQKKISEGPKGGRVRIAEAKAVARHQHRKTQARDDEGVRR